LVSCTLVLTGPESLISEGSKKMFIFFLKHTGKLRIIILRRNKVSANHTTHLRLHTHIRSAPIKTENDIDLNHPSLWELCHKMGNPSCTSQLPTPLLISLRHRSDQIRGNQQCHQKHRCVVWFLAMLCCLSPICIDSYFST
jgi:hypothetical protein